MSNSYYSVVQSVPWKLGLWTRLLLVWGLDIIAHITWHNTLFTAPIFCPPCIPPLSLSQFIPLVSCAFPSSHAFSSSCPCIPHPLHSSCIPFLSNPPPLPLSHANFTLPLLFIHLNCSFLSSLSSSSLFSLWYRLNIDSCIALGGKVPPGGPVTGTFSQHCNLVLPYIIYKSITIA